MRKLAIFALGLSLGAGLLQAKPVHHGQPPRRASPQAVIAFIRKDLGPLPAGTRFKSVRWDGAMQEWRVTLEPPYIRDVWMVNAMATDYSGMCFF